jgi:hypothetical protein
MELMGLLDVTLGLMKLNAKSVLLALTGLAAHSAAQCPDYTQYSQVSITPAHLSLQYLTDPLETPRKSF